jgi:hypothetical protein
MMIKITQKPARGGIICYLGSCRTLYALMVHCVQKKRTHFQRSCYRINGLLMNARQNDLHGEMHRSYGVSKQCVATHIVPRDFSLCVTLTLCIGVGG